MVYYYYLLLLLLLSAGLTNQLLSCWVDPYIAWKKHWHSNCRRPVDGGGRTPRPVLLTGAKKNPFGVPD